MASFQDRVSQFLQKEQKNFQPFAGVAVEARPAPPTRQPSKKKKRPPRSKARCVAEPRSSRVNKARSPRVYTQVRTRRKAKTKSTQSPIPTAPAPQSGQADQQKQSAVPAPTRSAQRCKKKQQKECRSRVRPATAIGIPMRDLNDRMLALERERCFKRLSQTKVVLNSDRCVARQREVDYLDHTIARPVTPGPGTHCVCSTIGKDGVRWFPPARELEGHVTPGPGEYETNASSIDLTTGRSIGGTVFSRDLDDSKMIGAKYQMDQYSDFHKRPGEVQKGFSFGVAVQRPQAQKSETTYYDVPSTLSANRSASFGAIAPRCQFAPSAGSAVAFGPAVAFIGRTDKVVHSRSACFGARPPRETLTERKAHLFPEPGPGEYEHRPVRASRSASFGSTAARSEAVVEKSPGPAAYHINFGFFGTAGRSFTGGQPRNPRYGSKRYLLDRKQRTEGAQDWPCNCH